MCQQIALQSPVQIFIQKKTHLGGRECVLPRFFKESDDLRTLYVVGRVARRLLMPAAWPLVRGLLLFAGLSFRPLGVCICSGCCLPARRCLRPMRHYLLTLG